MCWALFMPRVLRDRVAGQSVSTEKAASANGERARRAPGIGRRRGWSCPEIDPWPGWANRQGLCWFLAPAVCCHMLLCRTWLTNLPLPRLPHL